MARAGGRIGFLVRMILPRKNRGRGFTLLRFLLLLSSVSLLWYFCSKIGVGSQNELVVEHAQDSLPSAPLEQRREPVTYIVKPGDTFAGILSQFGVSQPRAIAYYRSLTPLGLSSLFPGDSLILEVKDSGGTDAFSLLNRLQYWYHVISDGPEIRAERRPVTVSVYRCYARGILFNSLSADMYELGVGDALVAKFSDIFAWDINWFMDPRKGDEFDVLFRKKYAEGRFIGYGDILAARYRTARNVFYAFGFRDKDGKIEYYDLKGRSVQKQFLKAPLRYSRISSGYSFRRKHPILGIVRPHLGIDYAAPVGTPIYSAADGVVTFVGRMNGYGKHVRIAHGASYMTYYGHLHRISRSIRKGAQIKQGEMIGRVGATGLATGPHLDYRMKIGSRFVNPLTISAPAKDGVGKHERERFERIKESYLVTFDTRFADQHGYWVLDIEGSGNKREEESNVAIKDLTAYGSESGS